MDETAHRILSAFDDLGRAALNIEALLEQLGGAATQMRAGVLDAVPELVNAGLLRAEEAGTYSRTEDGRLAVASPRTITLYTRAGCHLCAEAKAAILPLAAEFGAKLCEVDIEGDRVLRERYTNEVPVIFIGARFFANYRVDPGHLRRLLAAREVSGQGAAHREASR